MQAFRRPAEWEKKKRIWLAWPYDETLWQNHLLGAQEEFLALCQVLKRERLAICVPNKQVWHFLKDKLEAMKDVTMYVCPYGDIWLRDIGPIFVKNEKNATVAVLPRFNGWGNKYVFSHDRDFAMRLALQTGRPVLHSPLIFEGGAIECDGQGTLLTTRSCVLNANRNRGLSISTVEQEFRRLFGSEKVIWLRRGLCNDHTDGHVDTLARFVAPGVIAVMRPTPSEDPNQRPLREIEEDLRDQRDAQGRKIELVFIPSPGTVVSPQGEVLPASYLNFVIGNETVVVPTYGSPKDDCAVRLLGQCFPRYRTVGVKASAILTGGGTFHCMSQEEPI